MEHYVTVFDGLFLPQGLALQRSMERHLGEYTLWIVCVDSVASDVLGRLNLPNVRPIRLEEIETPELRLVKQARTRAEYCWTLTPQAPRFVFDRDPSVQRVTYIDADLWFMRPAAQLFAELERSGKCVLITDHAYAPDHDQTATSGRFCVQFITWCRQGCEDVLRWWGDKCIEWCYARLEDGRFGDQKYLDDWPERFADKVHVSSRLESIVAPWNATRFPYGSAIAYHFHGLRLLESGRVMLFRGYDIPGSTQAAVYGPYLQDLAAAVATLALVGHRAPAQARKPGLHIQAGIALKKLLRTLSRLKPIATARLPVPASRSKPTH